MLSVIHISVLPIVIVIVQHGNQARIQGGCTGCTCTPSTWEKSSAQRCPKEERKSCPNLSAKKNVHVPLRYDKIKTKKIGKKEEKSKRKGI